MDAAAAEPNSHEQVRASRLARDAFVGRERELDALRGGLERSVAGRGSVFMVVGEPGAGKTALLDEFSARVRESGLLVLWGKCWESGGAPAYWPWVQVIRAYVQARGVRCHGAAAGPGGIALAELVPELREDVGGVEQRPPSLEAERTRFALFDAVAVFLKGAAAREPLVLVLDDLHGADLPSLELLRFLSREVHEARILVVGSYRDIDARRTPQVAAALGEIATEAHHLPLRGFGRAEVGRFIERTYGHSATDAVVASVHDATDGNPFFVDEVVRLLAADGRLDGSATPERLGIPDGVREAIRRRLVPLSADCRAILTIAAVAGREFDLACVGVVAGLSADALGATLDEALGAAIIVERSAALGRYAFSHVLVRDCLYDDLTPARRLGLHLRVAEALEELHTADPDRHLDELAHHFFQAAAAGGAQKSVGYSTRAGDRALRLLAYEESVAHYERALQALELEPPEERRRCELLLALGQAQARAGDSEGAKGTFERTAQLARALGSADLLGRAALGYGDQWSIAFSAPPVDHHLLDLLEEVRAALGDEESPLAARVTARLALKLCFSGGRARGQALSRQALALAHRLGDTPTLAYTLCAHHEVLLGPDHLEERRAVVEEIFRLARESGSKELMLRGHARSLYDLLEVGDMTALDCELEEHARLARELRAPFDLWLNTICRAQHALFQGRLDDGEHLANEALALALHVPGQHAAEENARSAHALQTYIARRERSSVHMFEPTFRHLVECHPEIPAWRVQLARLYAELGRDAEARGEFDRLAADDFASLPRDTTWLAALGSLAEVSAHLADRERAVQLYELLRPYAARSAEVGCTISGGPVSRYLGLLATTLHRWDDAGTHFEAALAIAARTGSLLWIAETAYAFAAMLLARGDPADAERAHALLASARETTSALGLTRVATNVEALTASAAVGPAAVTEYPTPPCVAAPGEGVFRKEGEYWTIAYAGAVLRLKDARGLAYLAQLLRYPGREFHAAELMALVDGPDPDRLTSARPGCREGEAGLHLGGRDDAGSLPDARARAAYKARLGELHSELAELTAFHDTGRTATIQEEIDRLTRELTGALGLGGHARRAGSAAERARLNVTRAINRTLARVAESHPALGAHLARTLKTGTFCSYGRDASTVVSWTA